MSNPVAWGADVPVSMPEVIHPDEKENSVELGGGYVMTEFGLRHKFTSSDAEVYFQPTYGPLPSPETTS